MNTDHDTEILKIAEKVSDAEPVNWADASGAHPALESTLSGLQLVEAVADAFRTAPDDDPKWEDGKLRTWQRLEVIELIGEGSFGEVYRARDPILDREVALKLRKQPASENDEGSLRRALDEGRRLARVRHPNVLTVHGADVDQDRVGLWTEFVDGPDMRGIIGEHGPLEPAEAVNAAISLCRALNAVHKADIVHGDVKASNVFSDADGRIVLGDFGSAAELDSSGVMSGSPVSLAPERLRGAPAEPPSDVYSLGVLLYFMLSGRYPVEGTTVDDLLEQHEKSGPIPLGVLLPKLPEKIADVVDRAVHSDPARRFTTAGEFEHALEKTQAPNGKTATSKKDTDSPNRRQIRTWSILLAAAALAVVVLLGRAVLSPPRPEPLLSEANLMLDTIDGPVALEDGASITPGDHLYLEIEAEAPVHVYVANEDENGAVFTLFPIPGLDLVNPLPAGRHRLPGTIDGTANDWQVTSAGGAETFLVVAASAAIPELEERITAWAAASAGRAVNAAAGEAPSLRGVGGLSTAPGATGDGARLGELQHQLSEMEKDGNPVWSHRIVLNTPPSSS